jgi:hypothetical protein
MSLDEFLAWEREQSEPYEECRRLGHIEGDAMLKLSSIGVEISLDTVYEDTELDATRLREAGRETPAL